MAPEDVVAFRDPQEQRREPDGRRPGVRGMILQHRFDDVGQHRGKKEERLDQHHDRHKLQHERQPISDTLAGADDHDRPHGHQADERACTAHHRRGDVSGQHARERSDQWMSR